MAWCETFGPRKGWVAHQRITNGLRGQVNQPYGASRQAGLPATVGKESRRRRRPYVPLNLSPTIMLLPRLVSTNVLALPYTSIVTYLLSLRQPARRCGTLTRQFLADTDKSGARVS